ncbi:MAG: type II toxin-antitoxin system RelE/ParE family toxin [Candidatus Taylorbacteria bacterium]|nr:type II toxin-antitoxin system RelE/ParE family toxin [Candidatus Taylorbacteria bacterium]
MAYWTIELWENINGVCYVESDLLNELKSRDTLLLERLFKKKRTLTQYQIPYLKSSDILKSIGDDLWELRFILPKAHIRYLGCLVYTSQPPIFYALCAFRKKTERIPNKYIRLARERQKDFNKKINQR